MVLLPLPHPIRAFLSRFSPFAYLNITQFLGAMNDNIYKFLTIYFLIQLEGIENSYIVLSSTGALFVLPYLLFSSTAGTLADRHSKSNIIVLTKSLEFIVMTLGLISFWYAQKFASYGVLFLLATHSALFSPSKYGIVPELVPPERISRANGLMASCTYLAIIFGTFLASFLLDVSNRNFILSSFFCVFISFIGLMTSLCIKYTPPSGSRKKLNAQFVYEIFKTLKTVRKEPSLLPVILGSAFFLFIAAYVQLNMIPFAVQSLHLTDVQGGYLFLLTAMGIGTGSFFSGKISGRTVELALVPVSALGITSTFFLLDYFSNNLFVCVGLVIICGLFGGIYLVPLDSYLQIASPKKIIGQAIAASTFLSFTGVLLASGLLYVVSQGLGLQADKGFSILGVITSGVTIVYSYLFFDYLTRFVGMILSRLHFAITFKGQQSIPTATPALYVCTHTAWNDTLLMLGAQRRRMRFFIEQEKEHSPWVKRLYRLFKIVLIPPIEPLDHNSKCLKQIKATLNKGVSVCIFIEDASVEKELIKLKQSETVSEILKNTPYPMIAVHIEKGEKTHKPRLFKRLFYKFRVPATISFHSVKWGDIPEDFSELPEPDHTYKPSFLYKQITDEEYVLEN